MSNHGVLIITPTDKRDVRVIERCVRSVDSQTYAGRVLHVVCSDGPEDPRVRDWIQARGKEGLSYRATGVRTNSCGAGVRDWVLGNVARGDPSIAYIAHLDDDNVMLPHYLEANISALEANPERAFSICRIIHCGPLPSHLGNPPSVITGIPPVFHNIDTLQVVVRREAMLECGWTALQGSDGYFNDGYTYERLGKMFSWVEVPEILAVHL